MFTRHVVIRENKYLTAICLSCREIKFLRNPSQPFTEERDSCYINWALNIISSTSNILRIKFNALRIGFFKTRLHLCAKSAGSGWRRERRGRVICFFSK